MEPEPVSKFSFLVECSGINITITPVSGQQDAKAHVEALFYAYAQVLYYIGEKNGPKDVLEIANALSQQAMLFELNPSEKKPYE